MCKPIFVLLFFVIFVNDTNGLKRFFWQNGGQASVNLDKMINFIIQRLLLADKVAVSKWDSESAIEDLPREKIILENVVRTAKELGFNENWAKNFFTDQIEANKDIQKGLHDQWRQLNRRPPFPPVNLGTEVRPKIDMINSSLMNLAKLTLNERNDESCLRKLGESARYLSYFRYKLDRLHTQAFQRALTNICQ